MATTPGRQPGMEVEDHADRPLSSQEVRAVSTSTGRYRLVHLLWFIAGVVDVIVALRFVFKLLGASASAPFVSLTYAVSAPLVAPFRGIFPTTGEGAFVFEPAALVALAIYPLIAAGIVGIVRVSAGRRASGGYPE